MLQKVVTLILSSDRQIKSGTLYCKNIKVLNDDVVACIAFLEEKNITENTDYENKIGNSVDLELSFAWLNTIGFYETCEKVIVKHRYSTPSNEFYIYELEKYNKEPNDFIDRYTASINLINSIKDIAKHTYTDVDIESSIIFKEDKGLVIPFIYNFSSLKKIDAEGVKNIEQITTTLKGTNSEKKLLFINELIDFLQAPVEDYKYEFLLENISSYLYNCENAYQFYLSDYSYNKFKIELDAKALEFTTKIQAVINDSQSKLIAIPTAFLLVFATFDFTVLTSTKDVVAIISLFIFAIIIQLFLSNQFSILNFTEENISSYKETFKKNDIEKISNKFLLVGKELEKQKCRLTLLAIILWVLPASLTIIWLCLIYKKIH